MSGRSAHSIRNFSLELSQGLVLPNVGQVEFHYFLKYWTSSKLEMALTIQNHTCQTHFRNRKYGNLEISEFGKDARRKQIEICLVKSASISVVC